MTSPSHLSHGHTLYARGTDGRMYRLTEHGQAFQRVFGQQIVLNRKFKDDFFHHFLIRDDTERILDATPIPCEFPGRTYGSARAVLDTLTMLGVVQELPSKGYFLVRGIKMRGLENVVEQFAEKRDSIYILKEFVYSEQYALSMSEE